MEMSQIRYFVAVSETLNFTRAAERCCISQPALTKGIQKLENSIGGELLYRTKNSVELSHLGLSMRPKFKKILQDAKNAKDEAKRLIHQQCLVIRVGIENNIFIGELMPIFNDFQRSNHSTEFTFFEHGHKHLSDKLNSHELDVAFLSSLQRSNAASDCHEISSEEFVIAYGPRHPFSCQDGIDLSELQLQNYCFREHCESSAILQRDLDATGVNMNIVYSSSRDDWIKAFVQESFGVTYLPKRQAIIDGLQFVEVRDYKLYRSVSLHIGDSINLNKVIRPFYDTVCLARSGAEEIGVAC